MHRCRQRTHTPASGSEESDSPLMGYVGLSTLSSLSDARVFHLYIETNTSFRKIK